MRSCRLVIRYNNKLESVEYYEQAKCCEWPKVSAGEMLLRVARADETHEMGKSSSSKEAAESSSGRRNS